MTTFRVESRFGFIPFNLTSCIEKSEHMSLSPSEFNFVHLSLYTPHSIQYAGHSLWDGLRILPYAQSSIAEDKQPPTYSDQTR